MQFEHRNKNLDLIKEKINDIKFALFKSELNPRLQLPDNIIQTFKVENDGTIWFFTSCNGDHVKNIDPLFYAQLSYYQKGTGCRIHLSGKASLVKDDDDGLFFMYNHAKESYENPVLVKLKIIQAEIFENKFFENISWAEKLKNTFNHLFMAPAHRIYDFS
jgi:general stress protein 26